MTGSKLRVSTQIAVVIIFLSYVGTYPFIFHTHIFPREHDLVGFPASDRSQTPATIVYAPVIWLHKKIRREDFEVRF